MFSNKRNCGRIDTQAGKISVDFLLPVGLVSQKRHPNFLYNSLRQYLATSHDLRHSRSWFALNLHILLSHLGVEGNNVSNYRCDQNRMAHEKKTDVPANESWLQFTARVASLSIPLPYYPNKIHTLNRFWNLISHCSTRIIHNKLAQITSIWYETSQPVALSQGRHHTYTRHSKHRIVWWMQ